MIISFLHTMDGNEALFGAAAQDAGWSPDQIRHATRPDLRQAMTAPGAGDDARGLVHAALRGLMAEADAVVVTCATLGPAVDALEAPAVAVIRADTALALAASRAGQRIAVLCAVDSSVAPNRALFEQHAAATGATVSARQIPEVWTLFQDGQHAACMAACARAADEAYAQGFDVVAYAHPWMAPSAALVRDPRRALHSVAAALDAARAGRAR